MSQGKNSTRFNNEKKQENVIRDPSLLIKLNNEYIDILSKPSIKHPKAVLICNICHYHLDDEFRAIKHSHESRHRNNLNKFRIKKFPTYFPSPTKIQIEVINECLDNILKQPIFINKDEHDRRVELCLKMNEIAREINPGNKLVVCGSLLYGLSLTSVSDVNLFLDTESKNSKNTGYLEQLEKFKAAFKTKLNLKTEIKLEKLNCGLFCKDKQGVLYHISASNRLQYLTSELIKIYLKLDNRANDLAKIFRYFARKAFIDQIKDGLFSSETFSILVIFYLQQLTVPILPNLHKLASIHSQDLTDANISRECINDVQLDYVNDIDLIRRLWSPPINEMSLGELWIGLLKFYVVNFNSCLYMVSIRCTEPILKSDRNIINRRLAIEDPFDIKRNMLFRWNTPDVIDFLNDQLQSCFVYFAVPQLENGPAFKDVKFLEKSLSNMKPLANVTPIFSKYNFTETLEVIESEFRKLFNEEKSFYDVTKWPVEMFVKECLVKILTSVLNSKVDIENIISSLDMKIIDKFHYMIESYSKFKDFALRLSKCVLQEFSDHFEATGTWSRQDIETSIAFELIKTSAYKFVNESLNIIRNEDDNDRFVCFRYSDISDKEKITDQEIILEDIEEIDLLDNNNDVTNHVKGNELKYCIKDSESWKLPIAFKQIYVNIKGIALSSDNPDEYNEDRIKNIKKQDLVYNFDKIPIHDKKLVVNCNFCDTKGHREENCNYAIPRFEELQDILESVDPERLAKLKQILNDKYKSIVPNNDRSKSNEKIFEKISETIKSLFPEARPQLFGSTINGFITKASDLDICLEFYINEKRLSLSNKEVATILKSIGSEIEKINNVLKVDYILMAKVPIIKFYMKNNVQGDISINNSLGLQNTKMLKLYSELSQGVKMLGNLIKFVAKACEIGDASLGTLSSYAYMLMLIHFLQKRGILPVLQELYENEKPIVLIDGWDAWYQSDMSVIAKLWDRKPNNKSIEYLWLDFFYYYAVEFDIDKEVVSIRQSEPLFKIDKNWQSAYMAVEDPFNLSHNLCGSLSLENNRYILECFAHVLKLHCNINFSDIRMLLEPTILRLPVINNHVCIICNKQGHIAKDCVDKTKENTLTKINPAQSSLPSLISPLQFKPSNIPSQVYLHSEVFESTDSENFNPYDIPLKAFKADVNQFSVCPLSMKIGNQTVIVPMLVGKNDIVKKKLNIIFKNGLDNNVCEFPTESVKQIIKQVDYIHQNNTSSYKMPTTPNKNEIHQSNNFNNSSQQKRNYHNTPQRMEYDTLPNNMFSNYNDTQNNSRYSNRNHENGVSRRFPRRSNNYRTTRGNQY